MKACLTMLLLFCFSCVQVEGLLLRDNLKRAEAGDFIVTTQNKNYTLLHINQKYNNKLILEEITVPAERMLRHPSWREWVRQGAPSHTSWLLYRIDANSGEIQECYSISQNCWLDLSRGDQFLPTLLNLRLKPISDRERKKVGPPPTGSETLDRRRLWQPIMVVDGQTISGAQFDAWRTRWPKDDSPLSGRMIDIYIPQETGAYSAYFPYWLQVRGVAGQATIRIIDSGSKLISPAKIPIQVAS